jgi:hypothetical protein
MRLLALAGAVLASALLAAALPGTGDAKKKKTFCQKAVARFPGTKVESKKGGVTVYRQGRTVNACTNKHKVSGGYYIMDPGYKIAKVAAANKRCLAVLMTANGQPPEILFKDLAGDEVGSTVTVVGFGQESASVGSIATTRNCGTAWGERVTGGGTTTYTVRVKGFGAATDLPRGPLDVATVGGEDDIRHVTAKAAGRKVDVSWTQGGARQTRTVP